MNKQKANHKCVICGTMYHSCDSCNQIKTYTPWRALCDTFPHYNIYLIIRSYQGGIVNKTEAKSELQKLNVSKEVYANWPDNVKKALDEILDSPSYKRSNKRIIEIQEKEITEEPKIEMESKIPSEEIK